MTGIFLHKFTSDSKRLVKDALTAALNAATVSQSPSQAMRCLVCKPCITGCITELETFMSELRTVVAHLSAFKTGRIS